MTPSREYGAHMFSSLLNVRSSKARWTGSWLPPVHSLRNEVPSLRRVLHFKTLGPEFRCHKCAIHASFACIQGAQFTNPVAFKRQCMKAGGALRDANLSKSTTIHAVSCDR